MYKKLMLKCDTGKDLKCPFQSNIKTTIYNRSNIYIIIIIIVIIIIIIIIVIINNDNLIQ